MISASSASERERRRIFPASTFSRRMPLRHCTTVPTTVSSVPGRIGSGIKPSGGVTMSRFRIGSAARPLLSTCARRRTVMPGLSAATELLPPTCMWVTPAGWSCAISTAAVESSLVPSVNATMPPAKVPVVARTRPLKDSSGRLSITILLRSTGVVIALFVPRQAPRFHSLS